MAERQLRIDSAKRVDLDPSSALIIAEAERRGIAVEILAPRAEYFRLRYGNRALVCRESLSELTSAVGLSRCDDKRTTARILRAVGLRTPEQIEASGGAGDECFMDEVGALVVKPARGEQGRGISVGVSNRASLRAAISRAAEVSNPVLLEELVAGEDLRVVVIDGAVVAAAVRRPPSVCGDGVQTIAALIEQQSQRRQAETAGESKIPIDAETERCLSEGGYALTDVLAHGKRITVRGAANLHQGGTLHDVTATLHPTLAEAACCASRALEVPVVGVDMIVPSVTGEAYAIIEVNERPGLANHEPQPTAARFVDFLFPETKAG